MDRNDPVPDTETRFANEFWKILAKLKLSTPDIIYLSVDENKLQLNKTFSLTSPTYTEGFALSMLSKGSSVLKALKKLQFLSSHIQCEPIVVIPFVKAIKEFYDPLRTKLEHYAVQKMGMAELEQKLSQVEREIGSLTEFIEPFFEDTNGTNHIVNSKFDSEKAQYNLPDEAIEKTWTRFIHLYFRHLEHVDQSLPIWSRLNEHLLDVIPAYLDTICDFQSIKMVKETDEIILTKNSFDETFQSTHRVFLRKLWSDKLISLLSRAFLDQQRLAAHQDNVKLIKWSKFFDTELAAKRNSTKMISPNVLTDIMEQSCREYGMQFSKIIFEKLHFNKQLERRLHELQAVCDLKLFAHVYANCYMDDAKNNDKTVRFAELKKVLKSPLLPPNMEKYWTIVTNSSSTNRFCGIKLIFKQKGTWPVNLIISEDLMTDLSYLMDVWSRLSFHGVTLNGFVMAGLLQNEDGRVLRFERRTQHFVASFRQVLYRVTVLMQKQIKQYIQTLCEKVNEFDNLNDLERYILEWRHKIQAFISENSNVYRTLIGLCNLADELTDVFNLLLKNTAIDQWTMLLQIRHSFVHYCNDHLAASQDYAFKSFEAEFCEVVKSIVPERFCL
ncbi:hypothetical protein M3Y95_00026600 [Aphelenchoides besseyi]|nr:hypothetical protein M3Y95_00026600 [Aphelenchoides besseyi]